MEKLFLFSASILALGVLPFFKPFFKKKQKDRTLRALDPAGANEILNDTVISAGIMNGLLNNVISSKSFFKSEKIIFPVVKSEKIIFPVVEYLKLIKENSTSSVQTFQKRNGKSFECGLQNLCLFVIKKQIRRKNVKFINLILNVKNILNKIVCTYEIDGKINNGIKNCFSVLAGLKTGYYSRNVFKTVEHVFDSKSQPQKRHLERLSHFYH